MMDENFLRLPEGKKSRRHSVIGLFPELPSIRKRKRKLEDDSVSLQSFESGNKKKSRRKSLLRVSSLANLLSPKASRKDTLKRSLSFKVPNAPNIPRNTISPYKAPPPSPGRCRLSRTWSDMMNEDGTMLSKLSRQDIKHQEAIYELYQGELDLIEDLNVVKNTYRDSMHKLRLMTDGELEQIFGPIDELIPIHEDLVDRMKDQRLPDGTTQEIGTQLAEWIPSLRIYISFCANQVFGKALLDDKKNDPAVDDFLQRCQDSPFSRKLDLWGLLDGARGRFMKYPLLLRSIHKYVFKAAQTNDAVIRMFEIYLKVLESCRHLGSHSTDWVDCQHLAEAVRLAEEVVAEADKKTGEAKCIYYRSRITYLYDEQKHEDLDKASTLLCNGTLKNNKGTKLQLFLFDTILVLTRLVTHNGQQGFQVYRDPIPASELVVEDLKDGEVKMGSFRSAFGSSQTSRNLLRVSFKDSSHGQSHTLMSNDEHDKRQWLSHLRQAVKNGHTNETDHTDKADQTSVEKGPD